MSLLTPHCSQCQIPLLENDFYIDSQAFCSHNVQLKCKCKYVCKNCKNESGWMNKTQECIKCVQEATLKDTANEYFKNGNFKRLLEVSSSCMESYPCQHYVSYIDHLGTERCCSMYFPEIEKLYQDLNLPFNNPHNPHNGQN